MATTKPKTKTKKPSSSRVAKPKPNTLTINLSPAALEEIKTRTAGTTHTPAQYLENWLEYLLQPKPKPVTNQGMNPHLARNLGALERAYGGNP